MAALGSLEGYRSLGMTDRRLRQRERLDVRNALRSIVLDAKFVEDVSEVYSKLPVLANLRAGAWYGREWAGSAYFKSTDGHYGEWAFAATRLNLQVARLAASEGGVLLVDSTRSGKRFPDSFSKTVPIWCAVLNHVLGLADDGDEVDLPPWVPASEASQINERLGAWVEGLSEDLRASIKVALKEMCGPESGGAARKLRPVWVCPSDDAGQIASGWLPRSTEATAADEGWDSVLPLLDRDSVDFLPIVCVSASKRTTLHAHREHYSWQYVQGAGDDEETWANGLTAEQFWANRELILEADGDDVAGIIEDIVSSSKGGDDESKAGDETVHDNELVEIGGGCGVVLATPAGAATASWASSAFVVDVSTAGVSFAVDPDRLVRQRLVADKRAFVKGQLKDVWYSVLLPNVMVLAVQWLRTRAVDCESRLLIVCDTAATESVAIATAITAAFLDSTFLPTSWSHSLVNAAADDEARIVAAAAGAPAIGKSQLRQAIALVQMCQATAVVPRRLFKELSKFFSETTGAAIGGGWKAVLESGFSSRPVSKVDKATDG